MLQTWECHDGIFGFPDERDLEPGVLGEDAVHVFMRGHCHSFAEAVCRLLPSAELVLAYDVNDEAGGAEVGEAHVLVLVDGRYLDARGWVDEVDEECQRDVESYWDRVRRIEREGWLEDSDGWFDLRVDEALPFVLTLLDRVGLKVDFHRRLLAEMLKELD